MSDRAGAMAVAALLLASLPSAGSAQPLRLRADVYAESRAPSGLIVLQGEDRESPWASAEGLVWAGAGTEAEGDVLSLSLSLRHPSGWGEARVGRFLMATGAIRPVHIDGASGLLRAPSGTSLELFAGAPVAPRMGSREYEVAHGGRLAQSVGSSATAGVSYVRKHGHGELFDEEVGADAAVVPVRWLDLAGKAAYDLQVTGLADATVSAAARSNTLRLETFAQQRSPSRILPATSLFSVLGDVPARSLGAVLTWKAAPRLDLLSSGAAMSSAGAAGGNVRLRALLRLDEKGDGSVGLEVRRVHLGELSWAGVRLVLAKDLFAGLRWSSELELVVRDQPEDRRSVYPWGLCALSFRPGGGWELAGAVEASASPELRRETVALARVGRTFEVSR